MAYNRVTCYVASGTGNSYRAARWLADAAAESGAEVAVVPLEHAQPHRDQRAGPGQLVGLYHPSHGLMPPWSMIKFLFRLPWGGGAHGVIVPTRGGFPLPGTPLVIPGGAGLALFFPLLMLLLKGYRVRAGLGIDMPANVLQFHWGFKPENVDKVMGRGQRQHQRLVTRLLSGRRYFHPLNVIWELLWTVPFVLWPLLPLAYLLVARVAMAKILFADTACTGCGLCAKNCPCGAIRMVGEKPKTPFWTHHCEACMRCMGYCQPRAVQASHPWMVLVLFATSLLTASYVQDLIVRRLGLDFAPPTMFWELVTVGLVFVALILLYYVFWGLLQLRPLRVFFTYATLTKLFPRRYHAPDTTARELSQSPAKPVIE